MQKLTMYRYFFLGLAVGGWTLWVWLRSIIFNNASAWSGQNDTTA